MENIKHYQKEEGGGFERPELGRRAMAYSHLLAYVESNTVALA